MIRINFSIFLVSLVHVISLVQCSRPNLNVTIPKGNEQTQEGSYSKTDTSSEETLSTPEKAHIKSDSTSQNADATEQSSKSTKQGSTDSTKQNYEPASLLPLPTSSGSNASTSTVLAKKISKMALLGDSIGVGLFSDTKLGSDLPDESPVLSFVGDLVMNGTELGEALREIDSTYKSEYPSAFIGKISSTNCFSLACQLGLKASSAKNHAVSGSRIDDVLTQQLPALAQDRDLIVIEIGANDFCAEDYNQSTFIDTYKQTLDKLMVPPQQALIVVVPIPNIPSVLQNAPEKTYSFSYNAGFFSMPLTCGDIRDGQFKTVRIEAFCPRLASSSSKTSKEWTAVNTALETLVNTYSSTGRIVFVKELLSWSIQKSELAMDCFHPNATAHKKLAQMLGKVVKQP